LNSGTTWASFNFSGKMELFIDLFIKFVIGLTIAGFANIRSFAEMPSRPVAFFEFEIIISDLQGELGIRDIRHFFLEKTGRQTLMSDPLLVGGYIKVTYIYITYNIGRSKNSKEWV
jgi:hypothetical protein